MFMFRPLQVLSIGIAFCRLKRCHNCVNALFHMQLSRFSVGQSVIVIYTICNIAVLLCLQNHCTSFDCMQTSRIDLEKISFFHICHTDKFIPPSLTDHLFQFFFILCIVADNNFCTRLTVQHIPALGFPQRTIFMFGCICIIGMYLNTQIIFRINDFNQKRKLAARIISKQFRLFFP